MPGAGAPWLVAQFPAPLKAKALTAPAEQFSSPRLKALAYSLPADVNRMSA